VRYEPEGAFPAYPESVPGEIMGRNVSINCKVK